MSDYFFNIGPIGEMTLDMWLEGPSPRCLVVQLPTTHCVGEEEFLLYVATKRHEVRGFKDALNRHFISRRFGAFEAAGDVDAFFDEARRAAEITDQFYGVDAIDMTEWLSVPMKGERWHGLARYIQTSLYTDFVFIVRTDLESEVERLAHAITGMGYLIAECIQLYPPTGDMLAGFMAKEAGGCLDGTVEQARGLFEGMRQSGFVPNYTLARDLAHRAKSAIGRGLDPATAVETAFASVGLATRR